MLMRAAGMAWQRWAGKAWQRWTRQTKPAEQGRCRQTQPADDPTSTGLAAKQQPIKLAGLAAKQQPLMKLAGLLPCSAGWWRECGGAGHSTGGLGPTYLSPSHLSPLPVSVHTHSLNLYKPNLAPTYFFLFLFSFSSLLPH